MSAPMKLRGWQAATIPLIDEALDAGEAGVVVACTGSGKSILLGEAVRRRLERLSPTDSVVISTSSRRLVEQLAGTLGRMTDAPVGRFYGGAKQAARPIVITTYQSLDKLGDQLRQHGRRCGLWVADECHRTETEAIHAAVERLEPASRLGVTATPFRSAKTERLRLWGRVLVRYSPSDALRDGVICPWQIRSWTGPEMDLDEAMIEMIRGVDGPGVVNAVSISDADAFVARLTEAGIAAATVHSALSHHDQEARLGMLREGRLRCVVYPSLLSEGADFPWLRWMGLRRKVGARVRFVQEVGRVLRTSPGKDYAILLDPRNLFEQLSLTYAEVLGWRDDPEVDEDEEQEDEDGEGDGSKVARSMACTVSGCHAIEAWARQLFLAAEAEGLAKSKVALMPSVRQRPASRGQIDALARMARVGARLPEDHAAVLARVVELEALPSMGAASDLLDTLIAVAKMGGPWNPRCPVIAPGVDAVTRTTEELSGDWYVAGVVSGPVRAMAILHGKRVIACELREGGDRRGSPSEVAAAAAVAAAEAAGAGAVVHVDDARVVRLLRGDSPAWTRDLASLVDEAPAADWRLCDQKSNPARNVAWAAIRRRRGPGVRA